MKYALFLLLTALLLSTPAQAQKFEPLTLNLNDPTTLLLGPNDPAAPKSKNDFINIYVQNCIQSGASHPELAPYMEPQCACTGAEMAQTMETKDIVNMFADNTEADLQYARMLLLAYIPCMEQTIKDIVFDNCANNKTTQKKLSNAAPYCACMSEDISEFMTQHATKVIPGFTRGTFSKTLATNNALAYALGSIAFENRSSYISSVCISRYGR